MSRSTVSISAILAVIASVLAVGPGWGATYYWDEDGNTAGFGTAGTGAPSTWAGPTPGGTYGWSTDSTGASAIGSVTTGTSDPLYFGTDTAGLGAGTITLSGTQNAAHLYFGKASGAITLNGGTINFPTSGGWAEIKAASGGGSAGATHTINCAIQKTSGSISIGRQNTSGEHYIINGAIGGTAGLDLRPVNNGAYIALNGNNTFGGNVGLVTGQLNVNTVADSGTACSLGQGSILSMGGGGGQQPLVWYTGISAGSSDRTFRLNSTSLNRIVAQHGALDLSGSLTGQNASTYPLHLSGTADSGTNRVSGVISDGSGTVRLQLSNTAPQGGSAEANFWALSGVNTFTGSTTLDNTSHLLVDGAGQLDSGSYAGTISINNSSTFEYGSSADQTLTGTIQGSGTGGLVASGSGTLTVPLGSTAIYTGPTTVNGGNLQFANTADLKGLSCSQFYINEGGYLEFESSVGGANRTVLNNKTMTFGSDGGGTIHFNGGNHLFQSGTHTFTTLGGSQNSISRSNGGFINNQGSGNTEFNVANGTDDVDLELSAQWNNGQITKSGAGTMAITGTHGGSYPITINAGTLEIGGSSTLAGGTFSSTIANGGALVYASSIGQTISGAISGTGALVKENSASTLTLSADNSGRSGATKLGETNGAAAGTISVQHNNALGTGGVEFEAGGVLDLGADGLTVANNVYVWNRTDTSARTIRLDLGGSNSGTLSGAIDQREGVANGFVADVGADDTLTLSGVISNGGGGGSGITKTGDGTLMLSGANTYSGPTTADGGTLVLDAPSAYYGYSGGQININTGSTLRVQGSYFFTGKTFVFGSNGGGNLDIGAGNNVFRSDNAFTTLGGSQNTITGTFLNCDGTGTRTFNVADGTDDADLLVSAQINNDGSVSKTGAGTMTFGSTTANSYSGGTTIDGGVISLGSGGGADTSHQDALGSGAVTVNSGGELRFWISNLGSYTIDNNFTLDGGVVHGEDGSYDISGTMGLSAGGGTLSGKYSNKPLTVSGAISGAGPLTIDQLHGGSGAVVTLSGNNTYSGKTTVSNGLFRMGHNNALGGTAQGTVIASGGALDTVGFDPASGESFTLNGAGTDGVGGNGALYASASGTAIGSTTTLGSDAEIGGPQRVDWNGQISDGANAYTLTKTGSGFYGLWNGSADYENLVLLQGHTSIRDLPHGTVTVTNSGTVLGTWSTTTLGTGDIVFRDGTIFENAVNTSASASMDGTMTLNGAVSFRNWNTTSTVSSDIGGTGSLTLKQHAAANGKWILAGENSYTGDTTIQDITTQISGAGYLGGGSYAGAITLSSELQYSSSADQTLSGVISGGGDLVKDTSSSSTLSLSGANTYNGDTTVSAGTLSLGAGGADGSINTASAIAIASGATFAVNQNDTVTQGTEFSGSGLATAGALAQNGSGTTILNTANTFGGTVAVNAGTLRVASSGSVDVSNNVTVAAGSTLDVEGDLDMSGNYDLNVSATGVVDIDGGTIQRDLNDGHFDVGVSGGTIQVRNGGAFLATNTVEFVANKTVVLGGDSTLEVNGGSTLAVHGQLSVRGGSTLKVVGTGADIRIGFLGADAAAGNEILFELDAGGVSTVIGYGGWTSVANAALVADGSAYTGGDKTIVLIDAANLHDVTANTTVTGFDSKYDVSIEQDQDDDEVRLVIWDTTPVGTVFRFK